MRRRRVLVGSLSTVGLLLVPGNGWGGLATFERTSLAIETAAGETYPFTVELAQTPAQLSQGLMYRRTLARDAGMLFLYGRDIVATMWMKNTLIPLDMLFITRGGEIVHIAERTVPQSLRTISANRPVAAVLELNGGTAARLGISEGDWVRYPAFTKTP